MPLEIRELIIKVRIEKGVAEKQEYGKEDMNILKQEILKDCIDLIRTRLNTITER